jgi:hypothetical protein
MIKRSGLSLLEVLIASGILLAAMLPLWGLMGSSHKQATMSLDELRASQIAAEILEQIENSSWRGDVSNVVLINDGTTKLANNFDIVIGEFPEYQQFTINIETTDINEPENLGKLLQLTINYFSKEQTNNSEPKSYTIGTFLANQ